MDHLLPNALVDKARQVDEANRRAGRKIAVAESCTGGLVSAAITEVPGASEVFYGGFVRYSNEAKTNPLKIGAEVIETFGAVSIGTAWAMALGALDASGADIVVGITGALAPCETTIEACRSLSSAPTRRTGMPILDERMSLAQNHRTLPIAAAG